MRYDGPSLTAMAVAALRATYTSAPAPLSIVNDPFARRLLPRPVGWLAKATEAMPRLGWGLHRGLSTISAQMSTNLPLRTAAIDDALRAAIGSGCCQLVVMGSGLDARAWRMRELAHCTVFELDRAGSHAVKHRRLGAFPVRAKRHRLVPIDFERETMGDVLRSSGFDPKAKTVWLWEAVAVYLSPDAISRTLEALAELSTEGSWFMATYTPPNLGQGNRRTLHWRLAAAAIGEPVRGELAPAAVWEMMSRMGFDVVSDETAADWAKRYWPELGKWHDREWERLVVARKGPTRQTNEGSESQPAS